MEITINLWTLVAVLVAVAAVLFAFAIFIEVIRNRRRRVVLEPLLGVVAPKTRNRRSTYIPPKRWSHQKGRHAK